MRWAQEECARRSLLGWLFTGLLATSCLLGTAGAQEEAAAQDLTEEEIIEAIRKDTLDAFEEEQEQFFGRE